MTNYNMAESYFLDAEKHIYDGDIKEAKQLLEELLEIEPAYGPAHNHLGWIYHTRLSDFANAIQHFKLAIRFAPAYPAGYLNYIYLLGDMGDYDGMEEVVLKASKVPGVDKSVLAYERGRCFETRANWKKAKHYYREAIKATQRDDMLETCRMALKRVRLKRWYTL